MARPGFEPQLSLTLSFPCGSDGKECAHSVGDPGSIPGLGRSLGGGNGNPLQYSHLGNPMDGGAWRATVHRGGSQSRTRLSDFHSLTLRPLGSITTSEWVSLAAPAQKRQEPVLPMVEPQPLHSTAGWLVLSGEHLLCVRHFPSTHPQRPPHSEAGPASSPWDRKV